MKIQLIKIELVTRPVSQQQSQRKLREIEAKLNSLKHSRQLARRGGGAGGGGPGEPRPKRGMSVPDLDLTLDDSQTASEAKVVMQAGAGAAERVTPKLNLLMRDQVSPLTIFFLLTYQRCPSQKPLETPGEKDLQWFIRCCDKVNINERCSRRLIKPRSF